MNIYEVSFIQSTCHSSGTTKEVTNDTVLYGRACSTHHKASGCSCQSSSGELPSSAHL